MIARIGTIVCVIAVLSAAAAALAEPSDPPAQTHPPASAEFADGGAEFCLACHTVLTPGVASIMQTAHFASGDPASPGVGDACQSCHGPAAAHVNNPVSVKPLQFGADAETATEDQNAACLACHESGSRFDWHASSHAQSDIGCAECHQVHTPTQPALDRSAQAGVCYTCHVDKRQSFRRRSHHPVEEGLVGCGDCHNPHGGTVAQLIEATVNDTCYTCHTEKRGPFLWEHPPVSDDCTHCHEPHGSVQPNLLVQRPPYLCQQCHGNGFHPGDLRSGLGLPQANSDNKLLDSGCVNCHTQVHGSNHPSGAILTR